MRRTILHLGAATISFIIGVAANSGIDMVGGFAVEELCDVAPMTELKTATLIASPELAPAGVHACGHLVVALDSNGIVYLNRKETGTLNDTSALTELLRKIFELREQLQVYVPAPDISSTVPEDRKIDKTVFIRAPRGTTYGEVADLIGALKAAGADPIGLVVDRPGAHND